MDLWRYFLREALVWSSSGCDSSGFTRPARCPVYPRFNHLNMDVSRLGSSLMFCLFFISMYLAAFTFLTFSNPTPRIVAVSNKVHKISWILKYMVRSLEPTVRAWASSSTFIIGAIFNWEGKLDAMRPGLSTSRRSYIVPSAIAVLQPRNND